MRPGKVALVTGASGGIGMAIAAAFAEAGAGQVPGGRSERPARLPGGGSIVNISSGFGLVGIAGQVVESASKGGLVMLSKGAAIEVAAAVVFLASDAASSVTGAVLPVGGGSTST